MFRELISSGNLLFFDGAMGTMLQRANLKVGDFPELVNFESPDIVADIYRQYADAGADILTTNSFSSNEYKLKGSGLTVEQSIEQAVAIARRVEGALVALDIGPIGQLLQPLGTLSFEEAYDMFARQIRAGASAGADLVIIETMTDLLEAKAAVLAAKENSTLPVVCTMSFQQDGRTLTGTDPVTAATVLEGLGADVLGVNCSLGPKEMLPIIEQFLSTAHVPVIVQPNAGMPLLQDGQTVFPMRPDEFASHVRHMVQKGVRILGGCCGTDPEYIRASRSAVADQKPPVPRVPRKTTVTSAARTHIIGDDITIIGERINPTGKKKLQEALRTDNIDSILGEAISQRDAGAHILDINCGLPEVDEQAMMIRLIREVQSVVDVPLQIDSTSPEVIEAGARIYNGKPLINSVNGERQSLESILPIAEKYGACILGLTLDEAGIPETARERFAIAERIVAAAQDAGIPRENVLIDCLVLTASAQQAAVAETLKAIRMVKEGLGVCTVLGVSNVSFGLPRRDILNRTYLAMALAVGIDAPIMNPLSTGMMESIAAWRVLAGHDRESRSFIDAYAGTKAPVPSSAKGSSGDTGASGVDGLRMIVINGLRETAASATRKLLRTEAPMDIVEKQLMPALDEVGKRYEQGDLFLPQLIQSAETVKEAFAVIKEQVSREGGESLSRGKVLLATVKGDIHDIGKNIVKVLLENYGYDVIDMGKDVAPDEIVAKVRSENIRLVGLSALMTTTVQSMEETIAALRQEQLPCVVMVGGAVLNPETADMIKSDYYAPDAQGAVTIARTVLNGDEPQQQES